MSYKITKQRLAEIVKEEMDAYFGTLEEEGKKPDFADIDGDGDKEEDMSDAAEDKKDKKDDKKGKKKDLSKVPPQLRKSMEKKMNKESLEYLRELIKDEIGNA